MIKQAIIFSIILIVFLTWWFLRLRIRYWCALLMERGWKSTIHYDRCLRIFNQLYSGIDCFKMSKSERKEKELLNEGSYTYGEVLFYSFVQLLELTDPKAGEVFYDLGSGGGKAVFIAGLVYDFSKACGIEKLNDLYQLSIATLSKLEVLPALKTELPNKKINIQFLQDDFLKVDISDGDIIFINATCFRGQLWEEVMIQLLKLKVGARIIVTTQGIPIGGFELKHRNLFLMSWGLNTVSIYERV